MKNRSLPKKKGRGFGKGLINLFSEWAR